MMGSPPFTNFTNVTSAPATSPPFVDPVFLKCLKAVFYAVISIVGTMGNTLVILAYRNPRMRSVTNLFIANLGVADLTVCIINTPMTVTNSILEYWPFGPFLCKVIAYIQGVTVFASVGTLMAIAADRYRAIVHPLLPRIRTRHAMMIIATIWIAASISSFPLLIYQKLDVNSFCLEFWPSVEAQEIYTVVVAVAFYVIPLTVISVLYFLICHNLNTSQTTSQEGATRARKSVIRMLVIVVVLFTVCWLPFHVMTLYMNFKHPQDLPGIAFYQFIMFSLWLIFANSCCNPVVYAVFNRNYRREFGRLLRCETRGNKWCKNLNSTYDKDRRFSSDTRTYLKTSTNYLLKRKSFAQEDVSFQNGTSQEKVITPRIDHGNYSNGSGGSTRGYEEPCVESRL